jgi:AsmA protein
MSVWIRRGALALLAVVVVMVALATWFVATFDTDRVKRLAVDWMRTEHHRTLAIDGPIELSVFPRLAVKVSRASLSEAGRPDNFASLEQAALGVAVMPLLRGDIVIGRVEAHGVRLNYRRDAHGRSNIDDLLQPAPASPPREKQESTDNQAEPARFDISGIALDDVRMRVKDDIAQIDGELQLASFSAGHLANKVEAPVALDAKFDFRQPRVKGRLSGDTQLTLDAETGSIALRDMGLAFKGDAPGASAVDATLEGSIAWDGAKRSVQAQTLAVKLSGHTGALKHDGSTLAVEHFAFDAAHRSLVLRQLKARIKGTQASLPLTLNLDWPELAANGDTLSGSAFSGSLSRGGDMPVTAKFKSSPPSGSFDAVRLPGFQAQLSSDAPLRKLTGTLRSDLTLQPGKATLALDKLDLQAKVEEPKQPALALAVHGDAVASTQRSSWKLAGRLNDKPFSSDGSLVLAGDVPQVVAKASFDALDLNRLLAPGSSATPGKSEPASSTDTPVDLSGLRSVNGQFSVQATHFAYKQYRIDDARIAATLDGGMLRVGELKGKAWGGQLDATAFADARASRIAAKGTATGIDIDALVKDLAGKDLIEGRGRVSWDLDTAGRSVNELKSRLKGSAALQLRDGAIKGINLASTLRQARAALALKKDAVQKARQTEKTDFSALNASFQIIDGVARNHDLDLRSPFLRLGGEGAIDIGHGRIDYLARTTVTASAKGQGSADLAALKGLTVPVRLSGPFESLDWKVQWSGIAAGLVRQRLEDKLADKLGRGAPARAASGDEPASRPSTEDMLKNKLKGLFK